MDELAAFNRARWNELARARIEYSVPALALNHASARKLVDERGLLGDLANRQVLCLAGGGGQQGSAFAILGSAVTVLDLSDVQLEREREAAAHYGAEVRTEQGDMRDLSRFSDGEFDIVWQAHSLNFVPDASVVFTEVSRVLKPRGDYQLSFTNPFIHGTWHTSWNGTGYLLAGPYRDEEVRLESSEWEFVNDEGTLQRVKGPREFRHTLGSLINGLIDSGFRIAGCWEDAAGDENAKPGSWKHFKQFAAPWITILAERE